MTQEIFYEANKTELGDSFLVVVGPFGIAGAHDEKEMVAAGEDAKQQSVQDDFLSILASLRDLEGACQLEILPYYENLYAALIQKPDLASLAGETLKLVPTGGAAFGSLTLALSKAGHDEAQEALADALRHSAGDNHRLRRLLPSFATLARPSVSSEQLLWEIIKNYPDDADGDNDVRGPAELALGAMGYHLRELEDGDGDGESRAAAIYDRLLLAYQAAEGRHHRETLLMALGNVGDSRHLEHVEPELNSDYFGTRLRAVDSLRRVKTYSAKARLTRMYCQEPDALVRRKILESLDLPLIEEADLCIGL